MAPDGQSVGSGMALKSGGSAEDNAQENMLERRRRSGRRGRACPDAACPRRPGAYAPNTERALRADVAILTGWCVAAGLVSLPAVPGTVAAFVDAMGDAKAPAIIRRYVSSVATFHQAARLPNLCHDGVVRLALKPLHRARGRAQAQASPLTRDPVDRMLTAAGNGVRDLRNRALLAVAYDRLCRRSELVALQLVELEAAAHGEGTLTIGRSKTDQEGIGQLRYLAPDTMREVAAWLTEAGHTDGALFRTVGKAGAIGGPLDLNHGGQSR